MLENTIYIVRKALVILKATIPTKAQTKGCHSLAKYKARHHYTELGNVGANTYGALLARK